MERPSKRAKYVQEDEPTENGGLRDDRKLALKADHENRPLWVGSDGNVLVETFCPLYKEAYDFLIAVAEPVSSQEYIHQYELTPSSLYAAVSVGLKTETILMVLERLSKTKLPSQIVSFIVDATLNYGKVKLVLQMNKYFIESHSPEVLEKLANDPSVCQAMISREVSENSIQLRKLSGMAEEQQVRSFEIDPTQVELVKKSLLQSFPLLEEYDFRKDTINPDLDIQLKPQAQLRPYQEKSLSKMFGNGRARSGIIVLPCGAGKSLVGVSAACRIRKPCLCLATSAVSVEQWAFQFGLWSTVRPDQVFKFTSESKGSVGASTGVLVTTYNMIAFNGKRSEESEKVIEFIKSREWGLLLMDEVHVVPAKMFRKVISITKSHCKLGLTATLIREDERIDHLNFLIGPKLFEANWLDLVKDGYIAKVQCAEVCCPMTREFYAEYLRKEHRIQQALAVMNPNKFRACEFLIRFHELQRKDKIIVFSDNLFALREYATKLKKPFICGSTSHEERLKILYTFKHSTDVNTIFLSRVGDTSIDIPEANVLIQISSHAGSRRQEAQRLGRILRAKGKPGERAKGGAEEFNAFFYSLVSSDTQEMFYSYKRQSFLINQGYSFKALTDLPPAHISAGLSFHRPEDQLELLSKVLNAGDDAASEEHLKDDVDDISQVVKRSSGSMNELSGGKGGRTNRSTARERHVLFKKRFK